MGKKILIVDDSASMRQMVHFTLEEAGYEVAEGVDGKDGVDKLEEVNPDVIITDINMPNMNGIELIKAVRRTDNFKTKPIIVLTTESEQSKQEAGKRAGATAWLIKPFTPEQLTETVTKVSG
jgi:two-component system, chemotaxis family, chemotaxis protein CheY